VQVRNILSMKRTARFRAKAALIVMAALTLPVSAETSQPPFKLTYDSPASKWTDALPLGNGRIGAMLATAAAWSPNPKNPPLYLDLPTKDGQPQMDVLAKWAANAPLAFVDQYIGALRKYRAVALDVGDQDGLRADTGKLHDVLDKYGIANSFEVYPGTHTSKVADRFQNHVMPFFNQNLCFQAGCR
jgi:hypothetical protein